MVCSDMTKRTKQTNSLQFTSKVHRQHASLKVTVPKGLCNLLGIHQGDLLLFELEQGDCAAVVGKLCMRGIEHGKDRERPDRKDSGG